MSMSVRVDRVIVWCAAGLCALVGALSCWSTPALALKEYVPGPAFGSEGSGDGQLTGPTGVAVDDSTEPLTQPAAGDVYVLDTGNNRVERFSSTGVYISQFNGSGALPGEGKAAPTGQFSSPEQIAVDNSTDPLDPSAGDVYVADAGHRVVDKFSSTGAYLSQLTETTAGFKFENLEGLAVDPSGSLFVEESSGGGHATGNVDKFSAAGAFVATFTSVRGRGVSPGLAVDAGGSVYAISEGGYAVKIEAGTGTELSEYREGGAATALAVDPTTNDLLVDHGDSIKLYGPFGEPYSQPIQTFPEAGLSNSHGLAVDRADTAYATQSGADEVEIFNYVPFPTVTTQAAVEVSETSETLHGTVDPEGEALTDCRFEYGTETSYGQSVPCASTPAGTGAAAVSAEASGLQPHTLYHFRLEAANANGARHGGDETLYTASEPVIEGESFENIGAVGATATAQINAGGAATSYRVEYGTSAAYGSSTPEASLGAQQNYPVGVLVQLGGLQPETTYHFRFLATSSRGTVHGGDVTFTTAVSVGASVSTLPDNRVYELVTPITTQEGQAYVPFLDGSVETETGTSLPVRAAAAGNAVAYIAEPLATNGNGSVGSGQGNQFLATRSASGWTASDIQPPGYNGPTYLSFSSDLSGAILGAAVPTKEPPLALEATKECFMVYARSTIDGTYQPTITGSANTAQCGSPVFGGASVDDSHLIFEDEAQLTPEAPRNHEEEFNLYDSTAGRLSLVNILPEGAPAVNARFGSRDAIVPSERNVDFNNVISADGSRIFWTDLSNNNLYVRENSGTPQARTVQVDGAVGGGGEYWTASRDGALVFFTKSGDLYVFDVNTEQTTDLAKGGEVQGLVATSEDGTYVYFTADASLAAGATAGQPNLYLRRFDGSAWTAPAFIATLSPFDNAFESALSQYEDGDWRASSKLHTAEATPDGHALVLMSTRRLTGSGYNSPGCHNEGGVPSNCAPEVFVYDADTAQLSCASCNPSGEPPSNHLQNEGSRVPTSFSNNYLLRWISADGSRVFFDSAEALVPQDTNGVEDVYEWERQGSGACQRGGGCISLISGDLSGNQAYLLDASANGSDVFFTTRAQLVPQDRDGKVDVYDARVDGGFPESSLSCTGSGCQGIPTAPPIFATPSSVTFNGVGNFPPPPPKASVKSKVKKKAKPRKRKAKHHRPTRAKRRRAKGRKASTRSTRRGK
jgi:hypothetical protein